MKTKEQIVVEHGHCADERMPVAQRVELYQALAGTSASAAIAAHFFQCADDLAATERRIGQLVLDFGKSSANGDGAAP